MVKDQNFQSPNNHQTQCFFLKSSLSKLPATLSATAKLILQKASSLTKHRAGASFDAYTSSSIKDVKRRTRGNINSELTFSFVVPRMKTPKDIFDLLKLTVVKKELLRIFITKYHNDEYAACLGNKVLYCS